MKLGWIVVVPIAAVPRSIRQTFDTEVIFGPDMRESRTWEATVQVQHSAQGSCLLFLVQSKIPCMLLKPRTDAQLPHSILLELEEIAAESQIRVCHRNCHTYITVEDTANTEPVKLYIIVPSVECGAPSQVSLPSS